MERVYARALGLASTILAYSEYEADAIRDWLRERGSSVAVEFVPFGVDLIAFRPADEPPDHDVVSVGADPHRDFGLLLAVARETARREFSRDDRRTGPLARRPAAERIGRSRPPLR